MNVPFSCSDTIFSIKKIPLLGISIFFVCLAVTSWIAVGVYHAFPFTQDEYTYLYQAQIFVSGKFFLEASEQLRPFIEPCMVLCQDRLFSKYPPGFSMLLSLGVLTGLPAIVNPLLSAGTCLVLNRFLDRSVGTLPALCIASLVVSSSLFIGYGASFFAQPFSLFLTTVGLCTYLRFACGETDTNLTISAVANGMLWLVRPLDAVCLTASLLAGIPSLKVRPGQRKAAMLVLIGGSAIGAIALMAFNWFMCGRWSIAVFPVWTYEFRIFNPHTSGLLQDLAWAADEYWGSIQQNTLPLLIDQFLPLVGVGLLASAVGGLFVANRRVIVPCVTLIFLYVTLYNFHMTMGYPIYGARYWYPLIAPLGVLAGYGSQYLFNCERAIIIFCLYFLAIGWQSLTAWNKISEYGERFSAVKEITTQLHEVCAPNSIVTLYALGRRPGGWPRYVNSIVLRRNAFFTGDYLFILSANDIPTAKQAFPDRSICDFPRQATHDRNN